MNVSDEFIRTKEIIRLDRSMAELLQDSIANATKAKCLMMREIWREVL